MQEEELDSCRGAGERGPELERDEGAGRNQSGFSLRNFRSNEDREAAASPPL